MNLSLWIRLFDEALEQFREVQKLAPLDGAPHAANGLIYLYQGRVHEAVESLHRVRLI